MSNSSIKTVSLTNRSEDEALPKLKELTLEYLKVIEDGDFSSLSRFMHPEALNTFKTMLFPLFEREAEQGERELIDICFGCQSNVQMLSFMESGEFFNGFMRLFSQQVKEIQMRFEKVEVLGLIREDDVYHTLNRVAINVDGISVESFEVLCFQQHNNNWHLHLTKEIKGLASTLETTQIKYH